MGRDGHGPGDGRSLTDILFSDKSGQVVASRDHVLIGKERHDVGRPNDWGYPIRGIIKGDRLYLENFEPSRWPAGNPETGYLNCDGGATKTEILKARLDPNARRFWDLCFGKRAGEELYDISKDPDCVNHLAEVTEQQALKERLRGQMITELQAQEDPRLFGKGDVFEKYPYADPKTRGFYERFMKGEKVNAGWVNPSDFEKKPVE